MPPSPLLATLRAQIGQIGSGRRPNGTVLPFGLAALDSRLPGGGLALGALHEVSGGGADLADGAAAMLFAAGIAARSRGRVLWCLRRADLFAPGLAQAGLGPGRVIHVEAGDDRTVLACLEEGLRHGGLGAVVGDVDGLSMTASRRLHLAAKATGTLGLVLRGGCRVGQIEAAPPSAARTRWRISPRPSSPLPVPGIGRARWRVELLRCRGGEEAEFELEACDATGRLDLPAELADGQVASPHRRRDGTRA